MPRALPPARFHDGCVILRWLVTRLACVLIRLILSLGLMATRCLMGWGDCLGKG